MGAPGVILKLALLIPLLLSLTVREWAVAWSAERLGDDTARRLGRLSLNPLVHIDPLGTLLVPLIMVLVGIPVPFAWAKPVPVDPARFHKDVNMGTGIALSAAAGPLSNLTLAVLSALGMALLGKLAPGAGWPEGLLRLLGFMVRFNVLLAVLNLLPVPPLDGSRIAERFIPVRFHAVWTAFGRVSPVVLLVALVAGGMLLDGPLTALVDALHRLAVTVAG